MVRALALYSIFFLSASVQGEGDDRFNDKERTLQNWGWGQDASDPYADVKKSYGGSPYDHPGYGAPSYDKSGYGGGYGKGSYGKGSYGGGGYGGHSGFGYGYKRYDTDREKNKCEDYLVSYVWDYLHYLGFEFPSWCCLLSALAPPHYDPAYDFKPDYEHVKYVVEAIFKTAKKEHEMSDYDMTQAFNTISGGHEINGEESGYGRCDLGYHQCQLVYGLMYAFKEGFGACYCYYRAFEGCVCDSCRDENIWVDEISAYKGLPDFGDGVLKMETDPDSGYYYQKLIYTRIATCVQCPGYPPRPFNKCYGYCNLIKALPYTDTCFPSDHAESAS